MPLTNMQTIVPVQLDKVYNAREYSLENERRPLTSCQIALNAQDNIITTGCFINDENFSINIAQQAWDMLFKQYPFLTSRIRFDENEKWQFFEPQNYKYELPKTFTDINSYEQLDLILNKTDCSDEKLCYLNIFRLQVKEVPFKYMMLFQLPHSMSDGSSVTFLLQKFNKYYNTIKSGQTVKLDYVQQAPFTALSAVPYDVNMKPAESKLKPPMITQVKGFQNQSNCRQYQKYHVRFQKRSEFQFKKFKNATVTHSMYGTQLIMQCAYLYYSKQVEQNQPINQFIMDLIRDYEFYNTWGRYTELDFSNVLGLSIFTYPMVVQINFNSSVNDIITQIKAQVTRLEQLDVRSHFTSLVSLDKIFVKDISFRYPMSTYAANLGKFENESPICAFSLASVSLVDNMNPAPCNFSALSSNDYIVFNQQHNDGFSREDYDNFFELFKVIQNKVSQMDPAEFKIQDAIQLLEQTFGKK
ncbi:Conserved_hypothetical protein [Hexamita inflata]|uniref:Condensation domain-containing protein n=1 Tax=Hexamita inflata TaxID=28002 RepID=A0AA86P594_9EUKA|nr:Conserved hypothetical protein [Hexamita inflata]